MNTHQTDLWPRLRAAYRPAAPELDTASIMAVIRQEAAASGFAGHPGRRRVASGPMAAIPTWACAAAASLALLAAASALLQSVETADQHIGLAWMRSVQPEQFEKNFLPFGGFSL
jgi:hypothetical protein